MKILLSLVYIFGVLSGMVILPMALPTPSCIEPPEKDWKEVMVFYDMEQGRELTSPDFYQEYYCIGKPTEQVITIGSSTHVGQYCGRDIVLLTSSKNNGIPITNFTENNK